MGVGYDLVCVCLIPVVKAYVFYDRRSGVVALLLELCGYGGGMVASGMRGDTVSQLGATIGLRVEAPELGSSRVCGKTIPVLFGVVVDTL